MNEDTTYMLLWFYGHVFNSWGKINFKIFWVHEVKQVRVILFWYYKEEKILVKRIKFYLSDKKIFIAY